MKLTEHETEVKIAHSHDSLTVQLLSLLDAWELGDGMEERRVRGRVIFGRQIVLIPCWHRKRHGSHHPAD